MSEEYEPAPRVRRPPLPTHPINLPPRRNTTLIAGLLGVGGLLAVVLIVLIIGNLGGTKTPPPVVALATPPPGQQEGINTGQLAADFAVQTLDGQTVRLSDYRGKNPVWLNFWASWCGPCKAEMPEMEQLYQAYKDKGLVMLGLDFREPVPVVHGFVTDNNFHWLFLVEESGATAEHYYTDAIPTHLFIDKQGIIKDRISASLPRTYMETELQKILAP